MENRQNVMAEYFYQKGEKEHFYSGVSYFEEFNKKDILVYQSGAKYYLVGEADKKNEALTEMLKYRVNYQIKNNESLCFKLKSPEGNKIYNSEDTLFLSEICYHLYNPDIDKNDNDKQNHYAFKLYEEFLSEYIRYGQDMKPGATNQYTDDYEKIFDNRSDMILYKLWYNLTIDDDLPEEFSIMEVAELIKFKEEIKDNYCREQKIKDVITELADEGYDSGSYYHTIYNYDEENFFNHLLQDDKLMVNYDTLFEDNKKYLNYYLNNYVECQTITKNGKDYFVYELDLDDTKALDWTKKHILYEYQKTQVTFDFYPNKEDLTSPFKFKEHLSNSITLKLLKEGYTVRDFKLLSTGTFKPESYYENGDIKWKDKWRISLDIERPVELAKYTDNFRNIFEDKGDVIDFVKDLIGKNTEMNIIKCDFTSEEELKKNFGKDIDQIEYDD